MSTHTQNSGRERHKNKEEGRREGPKSSLGLHLYLEKFSLNKTT